MREGMRQWVKELTYGYNWEWRDRLRRQPANDTVQRIRWQANRRKARKAANK